MFIRPKVLDAHASMCLAAAIMNAAKAQYMYQAPTAPLLLARAMKEQLRRCEAVWAAWPEVVDSQEAAA